MCVIENEVVANPKWMPALLQVRWPLCCIVRSQVQPGRNLRVIPAAVAPAVALGFLLTWDL